MYLFQLTPDALLSISQTFSSHFSFLIVVQQVMRSNLEPLIDKLFVEDELFAQDFEEDGLNRVLFIRKMGIYVEVSNKLSVDHLFIMLMSYVNELTQMKVGSNYFDQRHEPIVSYQRLCRRLTQLGRHAVFLASVFCSHGISRLKCCQIDSFFFLYWQSSLSRVD